MKKTPILIEDKLEYEKKYEFVYGNTRYRGVHVETKGNDIDYPTFQVSANLLLGTRRDQVLYELDEED